MTKPSPSRLAWAVLALLVAAWLAPRAALAREDETPLGGALPLGGPQAGPVRTEQLEVELVAENTTIEPGTSALVGLRLAIEEHWHVYWKNAGIGTPPMVRWNLPEGWSAGPILWTTPKTYALGELTTYGYEGTFVLPLRLEVPADAPEGEVELTADVEWLVCDVGACVDGEAPLALKVRVAKGEPKPGAHAALFTAAKAAWPKPLPSGARASAKAVEKAMELELTGPGPWTDPAAKLYLFAETDGSGASEHQRVDPNAAQSVTRAGETTTLRLPLEKRRRVAPGTLVGILAVEDAKGRTGFVIDLPVAPLQGAVGEPPVPGEGANGAAPSAPAAASDVVPPGFEGGPVEGTYTVVMLPSVLTSSDLVISALAGEYAGAPEETNQPLWLLLLGAIVAGIVLNIMPCVLPVLSIKILGFVSQADEHPVKVRRHAYAFAVGVLASFWVLAALILGLRAVGDQLAWGFHFQSPVFVAAMAALMFVVGMNLAGVFEMGLSVQSLAGEAATKINAGGYGSSFWSGALATVIATPCTAPMMGPAVGYAMTAPEIDCVLVFTALGVGMALPYVLLSMSPRLLKKVPRPGPWMETFKHSLAFPMFATVIWLIAFVLADHVGTRGVLWSLMALLVLGISLWIYGNWGTPSTPTRRRWIVGYGLALLTAFGAWLLMAKALGEEAGSVGTASEHEDGIAWEKWSRERVAWRLSQGHVVFVDFTAKWCVSCLANEQAFIDTQPVREAIKKHNAVMLKADYTRKDKAIFAGLNEFGRKGVPLYLVYRPVTKTEPAPPGEVAPAGR